MECIPLSSSFALSTATECVRPMSAIKEDQEGKIRKGHGLGSWCILIEQSLQSQQLCISMCVLCFAHPQMLLEEMQFLVVV